MAYGMGRPTGPLRDRRNSAGRLCRTRGSERVDRCDRAKIGNQPERVHHAQLRSHFRALEGSDRFQGYELYVRGDPGELSLRAVTLKDSALAFRRSVTLLVFLARAAGA